MNETHINKIKDAIDYLEPITKHPTLTGKYCEHLKTAIKALKRQHPIKAWCKHKDGEQSALITCPECENRVITNYEAHREYYKEWYCKNCGQHLVLCPECQEAK